MGVRVFGRTDIGGDHDETKSRVRRMNRRRLPTPSTFTSTETPLEASHSLVSSALRLGTRCSVQCVRVLRQRETAHFALCRNVGVKK